MKAIVDATTECVLVASFPVEGNETGRDSGEFLSQNIEPRREIGPCQVIDPACCAFDNISQADAKVQGKGVFLRGEETVGEPGFVEERPELVARTCIVMTQFGRFEARVQPDKHNVEAWAKGRGLAALLSDLRSVQVCLSFEANMPRCQAVNKETRKQVNK